MFNRLKRTCVRLGQHILTAEEVGRLAALMDFSENILPRAAVLIAIYFFFEVGMAFLPGGPAWVGR